MHPLIRLAVPVVLLLLISSCYVSTQGYHLARDLVAARRVEAYVTGGTASPEELQFFRNVEEIRQFGRDRLGLPAGNVYTTYVQTDREYLVAVVSAAGELSFTRKEWWFPFFGRFPYRGYYRPASALRMARRLERQGWDVFVRPVDAFSTLGFFRDPLYTYMKHYPLDRLADLILHEMTHGALWVKNEGQFNEEFAFFVGRTGSREFMVQRFGEPSPEIEDLDRRREERATFRQDVLALRSALEEVFRSDADAEEMRRDKAALISAFQERHQITFTVNNAYVDLFSTYSGDIALFEDLHRALGEDLELTISAVIERVTTRPPGVSPKEAIALDSTQ